MLESQAVKDERKLDEEREKAFNAKVEALREAATRAAGQKYENLSERLKALLDRKMEIQRAPLTREEVFSLAREAL